MSATALPQLHIRITAIAIFSAIRNLKSITFNSTIAPQLSISAYPQPQIFFQQYTTF
jgi:hypothetical protein